MSNAAKKVVEDLKPIPLTSLREQQHSYTSWNVSVHPSMRDYLDKSVLWEHISSRVSRGDEIRVHASDYSWIAYLFVDYVQGPLVRCRMLHSYQLQKMHNVEDVPSKAPLFLKWRAAKKWSIVDHQGNVHAELIDDKDEAQKQLDELLNMIN